MNEDMVEEIQSMPEADQAFSEQEEKAAKNFSLTLDAFNSELKNAKSLNSLARVFSESAEFPLGSSLPQLKNENEKRLFALFQELLTYKSEILTAIMQKQANLEHANKQGEDNGKEQTLAEDRHSKTE